MTIDLSHPLDAAGEAARRPPAGARMRARAQADQAAAELRIRITEGLLPPGAHMSEDALGKDLGVSRNTLREAFRLLAHDGLLVHKFNRGVFVPELGIDDLRDVYRLRRWIEPDVVRSLSGDVSGRLGPLREAVAAGVAAAEQEDWVATGTANMHFHQRLVSLAGSPRLDTLMQRLLAELRLVFAVVDRPRTLYSPYVGRNRALLIGLEEQRFEDVATELDEYLRTSEAALIEAFDVKTARHR